MSELGATGPLRKHGDDTWSHDRRLHCPACGYGFDAHSGSTGAEPCAPQDGDWSVCFHCGEVMTYVVGPLGLAVRETTAEELAEFARNPANTKLVRDLHAFNRRHPRGE